MSNMEDLNEQIDEANRKLKELKNAKEVIESKISIIQAEIGLLHRQKCLVFAHDWLYLKDIYDEITDDMICNRCGDIKEIDNINLG